MRKNESKPVLETARLFLREMTEANLDDLKEILQDEKVMTAYEGAFSEKEVRDWLSRQQKRYRESSHTLGLWAVVDKQTGEMLGQCGATEQNWNGETVLEIGYLFKRKHWKHGYAIEAAKACKAYVFDVLNQNAVYSIIRDTNRNSQSVAKRNGMDIVDHWTKHYRGVDMPHDLWRAEKRVCDEVFLWYSENEK